MSGEPGRDSETTSEFQQIRDLVAALETDFGVPSGFIQGLPREDDWSFTIKTQALIEAAVTQLVLAAIGRKELAPAIEAAPLLGRSGKLAMAQSLQLLEVGQVRFVERLGQLRNKLVHDVRTASFTYAHYLSKLSKGERDTLLAALFYKVGKEVPGNSHLLKSVSFTVWIHLLAFLAEVNKARSATERAKEVELLEAEIGRAAMDSDSRADEYA